MKQTFSLMLVVTGFLAFASYGYTQGLADDGPIVHCEVTEIQPKGARFFWTTNVPPMKGDKISLDLAKDNISRLTFNREGHNGVRPSIPIDRAGASLLKVGTPHPDLIRFEGEHIGEVTRKEYRGILNAYVFETEAHVVVDILAIDFNGVTLNKAIMDCSVVR